MHLISFTRVSTIALDYCQLKFNHSSSRTKHLFPQDIQEEKEPGEEEGIRISIK